MANLKNKINDYQQLLGLSIFDACPKSVIAAIAVSALCMDEVEKAPELFMEEWRILYENGIVSQKPPEKLYTAAIAKAEGK